MSSCTGTLSTTVHFSPEASISVFRSAMSCAAHTCPFGTSCSAVTIPVAPVCLMSAKVMGSLGPNHRQVCSMNCLPWLGLAELAGLGEDGRDHGIVCGEFGVEGLEHEAHCPG